MPLPSPPSTRLSRVAPREACFTTSTPGMPYLAKMPFSLATNSGAASVSAMKPRLAFVVSGPGRLRDVNTEWKFRVDRGHQGASRRWS